MNVYVVCQPNYGSVGYAFTESYAQRLASLHFEWYVRQEQVSRSQLKHWAIPHINRLAPSIWKKF